VGDCDCGPGDVADGELGMGAMPLVSTGVDVGSGLETGVVGGGFGMGAIPPASEGVVAGVGVLGGIPSVARGVGID